MDRLRDRPKSIPSLLCLNVGGEWISADQAWLGPARQVLIHARENDWRVAHAHCRTTPAPKSTAPVSGLEPERREPVFNVGGLSAFHSTAVWQWTGLSSGPIYLIGPVFGLVGAATVVGAHVLGAPIQLLVEACGEAADGHTQASETRAHICGLAKTASVSVVLEQARADNVIDLRPEAGRARHPVRGGDGK